MEKPYGKSIHTGEEPYIYDFIIVSFIKILVYRNNPLSNLLVKINYFVHGELLATKLLPIQCLNYLFTFCSVKLMLIIIKEHPLYFSLLRILGIQLRFWTSHIHVEHCSMLPLTRLCYTLSLSQHQNVVTLVQLGCKGNECLVFLFSHVNCYDMNQCMRFPTIWYVRPAKAQTSLRIRAV